RIQTLVHDLLELSKLEEGAPTIQTRKVDMGNLLMEILPIIEHQATEKRVHFTSSVKGDLTMNGDGERLKQVFLNLAKNAIDYTSENGYVKLFMIGTDDTIQVYVCDSGIGIPKKVQQRIFERFYRVDKARSRSTGGSGLGLAIVKHIVEAHHGSIEVDSELERGTTFSLTFPR